LVVLNCSVRLPTADLVFGRGGQRTHRGIGIGGIDQQRQVLRARLVAARQAGGLDVARVLHAQHLGLGVHDAHEGGQPARIGAAQRVRGAVFARHQRQVQQFAARQRGADRQARAAALFGVDVVLGDGDQLFVRQMGLADEQAGHELGERSNGQHGVVVLAEQHFVRVLVDDQRDARLQVEHVFGAMQAGHLAEGLARRGFDANHRAALHGHHGLAVLLVERGNDIAASTNDLFCFFRLFGTAGACRLGRGGALRFDRYRTLRLLGDGGLRGGGLFLFRGLGARQQKRRRAERDGDEFECG
jgi:hypothetical protein